MKKGTISILVLLIVSCKMHGQSTDIKYGDSLFFLGNYSKAIEVYKNNNQLAAYEKIAEAYMGIGNYDLSLEYYKKCIKYKPNNIFVKYKYGKLLSKTRKDNEALKVFNELVEQDNHNPNYYYELGLILEHQQKPEALEQFKTVFKLDSTHQKAIFKLAKNQLIKKQVDSVNYYVDKGLKLYPNNKSLMSLKAQNYYRNKEYKAAIKWFHKLIELNESTQFIHEKLRNCYTYISKPNLAVKHGLIALEFDPKDASNLNNQSELYVQIEDYANAEIYMQKTISIMDVPLDGKYVRLGYFKFQQAKYKEAIECFKQAIHKNSKNEDAHFYLIYAKDKYYKDFNTKIMLYENFMKKYPKSKFKNTVELRLKSLRKEKFLKGGIK